MTEQGHEEFIHFATCMRRLFSAQNTLSAIKESGDNPLIGPAFRFALIEYAAPYTRSNGSKKGHYLNKKYVPTRFLELHSRILTARRTIHAHSDLTVLQAKLYVMHTQSGPSAEIHGKNIDELKELANIDQILELIEGTLLNMFADQEALLRALKT